MIYEYNLKIFELTIFYFYSIEFVAKTDKKTLSFIHFNFHAGSVTPKLPPKPQSGRPTTTMFNFNAPPGPS